MTQRPLRAVSPRLLICLCLLLLSSLTAQAEGPLYPNPTDRFGVDLRRDFGRIIDYDVASLHIAWYSDWSASLNPFRPGEIEYAQVLAVREGVALALDQLGPMVDFNAGSLWMIGNEPECIWQGNNTPEQYATAYHQLYTFIKERDPTAQVAIGGVVEPTPLRLKWLDRALNFYQSSYGQPMPVDVWNIHNMILPEVRGGWGCEIPQGLTEDSGRLYTVEDNDNLQYFVQHIVDFRTWMRERGQRDKPLLISEYGVLMPVEYGLTAERVNAFMNATFDYLLSARDEDLGYPADENRLVQRWAWYSLNDRPWNPDTGAGFNGALFDYRYPNYPGMLTVFGRNFRRYTAALVGWTIEGKVTLQRPGKPVPHPSWSVPLTVTVCGTRYEARTDQAGNFSVSGPLPGTCDIVVKNGHTLGNIRRSYTLVKGVNTVDMGELKEGDANADNCVNILDFSLLATYFLRSDRRPDFNEDGIVNISDFSLLARNFGQCGNIPLPSPPSGGAGQP